MDSLKGIVLVCFVYGSIYSLKHCLPERRILKFYKIKSCSRSTLPIIAWTNVVSLQACIRFVQGRNGLAFNYSPSEASDYRDNYVFNCHALGCPETENNASTLVVDTTFDYYSAYGNFSMTENTTCIKSVGVFTIINEKQNYTESIKKCQNIGADLANVLSESRTNQLSQYINDTIEEWFKAAYIGLDDTENEGDFRTVLGTTLRCFRYKAWGPGQPRSKHRNEDCVILDSERMWKVVRCKTELPALCEFYPGHALETTEFKNLTCDNISSEDMKKTCKSKKELFDLYTNSSRSDKCAILNYLYDEDEDD